MAVRKDQQQQSIWTRSGRNDLKNYDYMVEPQLSEKGKREELKFDKAFKRKDKELTESS